MPSVKSAARLAALALLAPTAFALLPAAQASAQASRQHADPSAEAYVQSEANRALSILADTSMSPMARKRAFYGFVNQVADVPRITEFVLGRFRRSATPAQYQAFSQVFRAYADSVYENRLAAYNGEGLRVTGSLQRAPGDVVVTSLITGGQFGDKPSAVNWRLLRDAQGQWKVVDVQAEGVWLAVVEQTDFTSTLANANGNIDVLTRQLQSRLAQGDTGRR